MAIVASGQLTIMTEDEVTGGGRNLVLGSSADYSTTNYLINTYTLTEDLVAGQQYTFVVKGTVPGGQQFGVWMNVGDTNVGYATTVFTAGVYYCTFTAVAPTSGNEKKISLYNDPSGTTQATVDWVAMYKGDTPLDWSPAPEESQEQLDNILVTLDELGADNKLTRFERSIVRGDIFEITGDYMTPSSTLPTLAAIDTDSYNQGTLFSIRKAARNIGVSTAGGSVYALLGTAYTNLATYLSGLTPKPWDTTSTATATIVSATWDAKWKDYYTNLALLQIAVQDRQQALSAAAEAGAVAQVSNSVEKATVNITNPVTINAPIATLGLPEFSGKHIDSWVGGTGSVANGNRYKPITNPTFSSGTDLTIKVKLYGDGTNNDTLTWNTSGQVIKTKMWEDVALSDKQNWDFHVDASGYKQVKGTGFSYGAIVNGTVVGVKYNGTLMTRVATVNAADQLMLSNSDNTLYVSVSDNDTGWGESYTPTAAEIKSYFLGWRMCNGTYNTKYTGAGGETKTWYPVGDANLSRAAVTQNGAPTTKSPAINNSQILPYQIIFRMSDVFQETVDFDGLLILLQGVNEVSISYPSGTPEIVTGVIKYATNLATVSEDTRYILPSIQKRLASAEQKITDDSIVSTVTNSVEYQTIIDSKANAASLSDYATRDELDGLSGDVDSRIAGAVGSIDFSPYVTQSQLEQTAQNITAKFSTTGGMNLVKNSIGFAELDFWDSYTAYLVDTIRDNTLDSLGFGSGFYFKADGHDKGISQTLTVTPGQPYTLSWYLNKLTSGVDSSYRFFIQIIEDGVITQQIADNSENTTVGYKSEYMTYTPQTTSLTIRFLGYANVEAMLSGIMFTIGEVPLSWTLATGEVYNTNIRMNINGIRVSQLDADGNEIGFTIMSPEEFAGYYSTSNDGVYEKVFYLNGDETVTKKMKATQEITLGTMKILSIQSTGNTGWAFVSNSSS